MKKIKAKAISLFVFNGRISDSSTSSTSSSNAPAKPTKKRSTCSGAIQPSVFCISTASVASLLRQNKQEQPSKGLEEVELVSVASTQQVRDVPLKTTPSLNTGGPELSSYEKLKVVGQGSFGIAILYRRKSDNQHVVLKQINLINLTPSERALAMNEVEVFSKLHHPNIVSYLGSFIKDNTLLIEMEYADGGTLAQMIAERQAKDYFAERYVIAMFEQISSAINYMHSENILHRDLKTANVFLSMRGTVKIGDFGISKIMNTKIHAQTVLGTPYYFSPEMCEGKEYDHKGDIWALGCILGEMCCLKKAFAASNLSQLVNKIMTGAFTPLPSGYSSGLRSLLGNLLQVDAARRPKATELLEYWIPLVFRNLGKNKGYTYEAGNDTTTLNLSITNNLELLSVINSLESMEKAANVHGSSTSFTNCSKGSTMASSDTAQTYTRQIMNAETMQPHETKQKQKRSVLYQLKSFGNNFSMNAMQLPPKVRILSVATSDSHFVVVNDDGSVYTWGEGSHGQLGLSSLEAWKHYPSRMESVRNYHIVGACAGDGFTILLSQTGALLSCGDNSKYALGHNDTKTFYSPRIVDKLDGIPIAQVEAGLEHVLALSTNGAIYTWGTSAHGALGLGSVQTQQKIPQKVSLSRTNAKVEKIFCGPDTSALLFSNGDVHVCGSNNYNKLGFKKPSKITTFKKVPLPHKVQQASFSSTHSVFLVEGGYVFTAGRNTEGQRGLGHCNVVTSPTMAECVKDRFIVKCKCNDLCTIVGSEDNVITFWGTRNGIPNMYEGASAQEVPASTQVSADFCNNTAAFTNFLASVYKSELILEPVDILALYASEKQFGEGSSVEVNDIYPLAHSVLVLVDTTTPPQSSLPELS